MPKNTKEQEHTNEEHKNQKEAATKDPSNKTDSTSPFQDVAEQWPPQPEPGNVEVPNDIIQQCTEEDWKAIDNFVKTADENTAENKNEYTEKKYIGTIYNGKEGDDKKPLVHISPQGLVCPKVDNPEDQELQATAIAKSLNAMASKVPDEQKPLAVTIKGFSAEELPQVLKALKDQKVPITFTIDPKEQDSRIKDLLTDFNNKQKAQNTQKTADHTTPTSKVGTLSPTPQQPEKKNIELEQKQDAKPNIEHPTANDGQAQGQLTTNQINQPHPRKP